MYKNIIITGAAGNLGKATLEKMVSEGYHVIATVEPGKTLGFYEDHAQVDIHHLDLMNEDDATTFVAVVLKKYKTIDAALLLVGGYAGGDIASTSGEMLRNMYALNFETTYFLARPLFKQMMAQKNGRIIMIGARPALLPKDGKNSFAYAMSKSLIFELANILNVEGKDSNVTATVIVPSTLDTPANRKGMPDADFTTWVKPEDVANIMAFVISNNAAPLRETVLKVYGGA